MLGRVILTLALAWLRLGKVSAQSPGPEPSEVAEGGGKISLPSASPFSDPSPSIKLLRRHTPKLSRRGLYIFPGSSYYTDWLLPPRTSVTPNPPVQDRSNPSESGSGARSPRAQSNDQQEDNIGRVRSSSPPQRPYGTSQPEPAYSKSMHRKPRLKDSVLDVVMGHGLQDDHANDAKQEAETLQTLMLFGGGKKGVARVLGLDHKLVQKAFKAQELHERRYEADERLKNAVQRQNVAAAQQRSAFLNHQTKQDEAKHHLQDGKTTSVTASPHHVTNGHQPDTGIDLIPVIPRFARLRPIPEAEHESPHSGGGDTPHSGTHRG